MTVKQNNFFSSKISQWEWLRASYKNGPPKIAEWAPYIGGHVAFTTVVAYRQKF